MGRATMDIDPQELWLCTFQVVSIYARSRNRNISNYLRPKTNLPRPRIWLSKTTTCYRRKYWILLLDNSKIVAGSSTWRLVYAYISLSKITLWSRIWWVLPRLKRKKNPSERWCLQITLKLRLGKCKTRKEKVREMALEFVSSREFFQPDLSHFTNPDLFLFSE